MTWEERMYMRAIMQRDPAWAKAVSEEMNVKPRKGDGCFMFYWDSDGKQKVKRASEWEVEQLIASLQRAWKETQWPQTP